MKPRKIAPLLNRWVGGLVLFVVSLMLSSCGGGDIESLSEAKAGGGPGGGGGGPSGATYHIGYDTILVNSIGMTANFIRAIGPYNVAGGTYLTGLGVALSSGAYTAPNNYQMALYSDVSGSPGTLIVSSGTGTWVDASINEISTPTTYLSPGNYWVLANTSSGTFYISEGSTPGISSLGFQSWTYGSWPGSAGATVNSSFSHAAYMIVAD